MRSPLGLLTTRHLHALFVLVAALTVLAPLRAAEPDEWNPGRRGARRAVPFDPLYGLMVLNPFGRRDFGQGDEKRVLLRRGERLRLRFAALFYSVPAGSGTEIEAAYQAYASEANGRSGG